MYIYICIYTYVYKYLYTRISRYQKDIKKSKTLVEEKILQ